MSDNYVAVVAGIMAIAGIATGVFIGSAVGGTLIGVAVGSIVTY